MNLKIKLLVFSIYINALNCSNYNEQFKTIKPEEHEDIFDSVNVKIINGDFEKFISSFREQNLPIDLLPINNEFKIFSLDERKEIERDIAVRYLCKGDKSKIIQSTGGYYQYYYGFKFSNNKNLIILLYFRPSFNNYSGYIISTFNNEGELIDDLFVAGDSTDFTKRSQMQAVINEDLTIQATELIVNEINNEDNSYLVDEIYRMYYIDEAGFITLLSEINNGKKMYKENKVKNYWLEPIQR